MRAQPRISGAGAKGRQSFKFNSCLPTASAPEIREVKVMQVAETSEAEYLVALAKAMEKAA